MALDQQTEKDLLEKVGKEATEATKKAIEAAEKSINEKAEAWKSGLMTEKSFNDFKEEQLAPINQTLKQLETAAKEQGTLLNKMVTKAAPNSKSLETFIQEQFNKDNGPLKDLRAKGGNVVFTGAELKAAGVYSIAGTIPTPSPYAPGIAGEMLDIFDVARNPNFITSRVDLGRTDSARMAWANELDTIEGGASANVAEGALKPQIQHKFAIETSVAKKAAGWIELTEELEDDLPQFATRVRRMLQEDVERAWDNQIQTDVQTAARPFEITGLNGKVQDANFWDALLAMMGQVGFYNFVPNTIALNWLTNVLLKTEKNTNNSYLVPSFVQEIQNMLVYANKMAVQYALVGDLKQYHVDIYKDFQLKVGWINDELIYNKFAIVGEMRYHSYISDNRKKALVYDDLAVVDGLIGVA